mmetsp:Transcript_71217/g.204261  ORF Transcript_71217/g.204261 Transcript_71217/m.204261 type:complete len:204 (-) Transcript_71217:178-789(-)
MPLDRPSSAVGSAPATVSVLSRLRGHAALADHHEALLAECRAGASPSAPSAQQALALSRPPPPPHSARSEAPDWEVTCRAILENDKRFVYRLQSGAAPSDFIRDKDREQPSNAEVVSGRQYPNRGPRSSVCKPPPPVPMPKTHGASKFAAQVRIARRNLGLPGPPERQPQPSPRGGGLASRLPLPPTWPAPLAPPVATLRGLG